MHRSQRPRQPVPFEETPRALEYHRLVGSVGRVGAVGADAAMESFCGLLQNNVKPRNI